MISAGDLRVTECLPGARTGGEAIGPDVDGDDITSLGTDFASATFNPAAGVAASPVDQMPDPLQGQQPTRNTSQTRRLGGLRRLFAASPVYTARQQHLAQIRARLSELNRCTLENVHVPADRAALTRALDHHTWFDFAAVTVDGELELRMMPTNRARASRLLLDSELNNPRVIVVALGRVQAGYLGHEFVLQSNSGSSSTPQHLERARLLIEQQFPPPRPGRIL